MRLSLDAVYYDGVKVESGLRILPFWVQLIAT